MGKLQIEDLKRIKDKLQNQISIREENKFKTEIIVHMSTCGISSGAREILSVLMSEINEFKVTNIHLRIAECIGLCKYEPIVTVNIKNKDSIQYKCMDTNKIRQVFRNHIMQGQIQSSFVLSSKMQCKS